MVNWIKNKQAQVITALFTIANVWLLQYHETWLDEVQAWEIQRLGSVFEIYSRLKLEGHPILWYLILRPFALLNFPIKTMNIISIAFMQIAVYLFLKYINVQRALKILTVFGGCMFYYNAINARTYSLVCLALVLIAITFPKRKEHPYKYNLALLLLTQTHIITCGIIAAFWLLEAYEIIKDKAFKERTYGFLVYSLGIIWLLAQLSGAGLGEVEQNTLVFTYKQMEAQQIVTLAIISLLLPVGIILDNIVQSLMYQIGTLVGFDSWITHIMALIDQSEVTLIFQAIAQIFLLVHLWNVSKQKLFVIYTGAVAQNLIQYFIHSMNVQRLLITAQFIIILQLPEVEVKHNIVDKIAIKFFYAFSVVLVQLSLVLAINQVSNTFGVDVSEAEHFLEYIDENTELVCIDDGIDSQCVTLLQYLTGKPYYSVHSDKYVNYLTLMQYSEQDYTNGEIAKPIVDLIEAVRERGLDPTKIVIPIMVCQEADKWSDQTHGAEFKLSKITKYFNIERVWYSDEQDRVMQLGNGYGYILYPNDYLIGLIGNYK